MYVRAVTEPPEVVEGPLGIGTEIYSSCASCHGAAGGGGVGYPFSGGEVLKTFPHIEDQIRYVYYGTEGYNAADVEIYGNPDREGGPHVTGNRGVMPAFGGQLTQYEIVAVVCHERYDLGGADPTSEEYAEEYETWCSEESPRVRRTRSRHLRLHLARRARRSVRSRSHRSAPKPFRARLPAPPADGARPGHRRPRRRRWSCRSVGRHVVGRDPAITSRSPRSDPSRATRPAVTRSRREHCTNWRGSATTR